VEGGEIQKKKKAKHHTCGLGLEGSGGGEEPGRRKKANHGRLGVPAKKLVSAQGTKRKDDSNGGGGSTTWRGWDTEKLTIKQQSKKMKKKRSELRGHQPSRKTQIGRGGGEQEEG